MDAQRWARIQSLFLAVLEREPDERLSFLDQSCAGDADVRREVEVMLRAHGDDRALAIEGRLVVDERDELATTDALVGGHVGPYRVMELIGQGGMGEVYLAERDDDQYRQQVALKLVGGAARSTKVERRFKAERQILARLVHPHISRLLDGGVAEDGRPYLVMEYVAGLPITDFCDTRRLSVEERLHLFQTVCTAVQFAHRNLVVHRDVKPSNVLVTDQGDVKLLDFGIAKLLDPDTADLSVPLTQSEVRVMTPQYAAPEQVRGDAITTATDVYSLGVLLYELLTSHRPYHLSKLNPAAIERVICEEEPSLPSTVVGTTGRAPETGEGAETLTPERVSTDRSTDLPRLRRVLQGDLDKIVMMALRKEPDRRYASAAQLAEDIDRYLHGRPVMAQKDTLGYRVRTFVRRNRTGVGVAAGVFALVLGFGVVMAVQASRIARQADEITHERDRAQLEAAKATQVADFLEDLFAASDPYAATPDRPDTLRVSAFLAQGAEKVRQELEGQPEVRAQLLHVLGRVFRRLGRYDEARPLLDDALDIRRELDDPDVAESLEQLGQLQTAEAQFDEARASLRAALDLRRREDGPAQESEAHILSLLTNVEWQAGRYDSAIALAEQALEIRERVLEPDDRRIGELLQQLGIVQASLGDNAAALQLYERALSILEAAHGQEDLNVASLRESIALVLDTMGDKDSALTIHREVLAVRERHLSEDHPSIGYSLHNMGRVLVDLGERDRARAMYERALGIRERAFGPDHPQVSYTLESLAILIAEGGDLGGARTLFERALAINETALGPEHPETMETLTNLAKLIAGSGDLAGARPVFERALAVGEATLGLEAPRTLETLRDLAILAALEGDLDRAIRLLRTAVDRGFAADDVLEANVFDSLRGNPDFEAVRDEVRRRAEERSGSG